jgi:integrase
MASYTHYPDGSCRVRIRIKGKAESKTFPTVKEAEHYAAVRESELLTLKSNSIVSQLPQLTFKEVSDRYLVSLDFKSKRASTQKASMPKLKHLLNRFSDTYIDLIDRQTVEDYIELRQNQPSYSNGKIRNEVTSYDQIRLELALLRSIFDFAINGTRKLTTAYPFIHKYKLQRTEVDTIRIPSETILDIENYSFEYSTRVYKEPTFNNWFILCYEHAMRPGECARIKLSNLNAAKDVLSMQASQMKNKQAHSYYLTEKAQSVVKQQYAHAVAHKSPYLFFSLAQTTRKIIPFNYSYFWRQMRLDLQIADKFKPHLIRHTKITELFEETTLTEYEIAILTGHKSILSLRPYLHLRASKLKEHMQHVSTETEKHRLAVLKGRAGL